MAKVTGLGCRIFRVEHILDGLQRIFDLFALFWSNLRAGLCQTGLRCFNCLLGLEFRLNPSTRGEIVEGMFDTFLDHALNIRIVHVHGGFHLDNFLGPGASVPGEDVQDSIGIDLELHADTWHSARRAFEFECEFAEAPVVFGALAFSLENMNQHRSLVIDGSRKHFASFHRNGGIAWDDHVHQTAESLETKRERCDIQKEHVLESASKNFSLDRSAECYRFVGVLRCVEHRADAFVKIASNSEGSCDRLKFRASEPLADQLAHQWHTRLSAHQNDLVQVTGLKFCIRESPEAMFLRAHYEVAR